jgi:homoserine acetyltransferase
LGTHGTLNPNKSNAILITHGTSGNRLGYNIYIGPNKAFDTNKYFVIAVDAIGGGNSSSPQSTGLGAMGGNFAGWDATNWMWRYLASREHDIAKPFSGNLNAALAKIKAKSILLPSVTDRTLPPEGARELYRGLKDATYAEIPSIRGLGANNPGSDTAGE